MASLTSDVLNKLMNSKVPDQYGYMNTANMGNPMTTEGLTYTPKSPELKLGPKKEMMAEKDATDNKGSKLRTVMLALGIPVKNMTYEERARQKEQMKKLADAKKLKMQQEHARLNRLTQVGAALTPAQSFVGSGQFGMGGPGIAPRGY